MFYNDGIKEKFLNEVIDSADSAYRRIFNKFCQSENDFDKDIAEMTKEEVVAIFKTLGYTDSSSIKSFLACAKYYARWCYDNSILNQPETGVLDVVSGDIDPTDDIREQFFRDEDDFLTALESIRDPRGGNAESVVFIFVWLGLSPKEALEIPGNGVDFVNNKVSNQFGEIVIEDFSDDIGRILLEYSRCNEYTIKGVRYVRDTTFDTFIQRFAPEGDKLYGKPLDARSMRGVFGKMNTDYKKSGEYPKFTATNVSRSGFMYRAYLFEQSGIDVEAPTNRHLIVGKSCRTTEYDKMWQYKYYKAAFNL